MELYKKATEHADEARQVMRAYPLSTYLAMAVVVIIRRHNHSPTRSSTIHTALHATAFKPSDEV
eukprot:3728597-Pleurochrysis_carterae.AAC.1